MRNFIILLILLTLLTDCSGTVGEKERGRKTLYGELSVLENRSNPGSGKFQISYAVIPAEEKSDRPPIVFIQGGPGGSSLPMVSFFENSPLRKSHDIILFDARGTGKSGAFCEDAGSRFLNLMAEDLSVDEEYEGTLEICNECKEELKERKVDLAGYNSLENAADMEALRKHLNIDKWILFGGSYGTRLGLTYLREYENAEAAVFMGLFPPEVNIYEGFLEGFDKALSYLFETCKNNSDCKNQYPSLKQSFVSMMRNLRNKPRQVSYRGKEFVINSQDALLLIHQMLYQRQSIQQVPAFIMAMSKGNTSVITSSINRTAQTLSFINAATYWSVQANEEVQFNEKDVIQQKLSLPEFQYLQPGPAFFASDQRILEQWHPYRSSVRENEKVMTETPILIVSGLFDPITPIASAQAVLDYLPNASLAAFPFDGHTIFNPCFFSLVESFVADGYKAPNTSCVEDGSLNWR